MHVLLKLSYSNIMDENQSTQIQVLMDELLKRLDFDIHNQPPQHLPHIANAMVILHGYKTGMIKADEKHIYEINMIKNVNNHIKSFGQGGGDEQSSKPTG